MDVCVCLYTCVHCIWVFPVSVGKTSLLHQYVHKTFYEDYQTTLGASILSKIIILDDTTLKLQVSRPPSPSSMCIPENHPTATYTAVRPRRHSALEQRSVSSNSRTKSGPPSVFVTNVLLDNSHAHLFSYSLWLL